VDLHQNATSRKLPALVARFQALCRQFNLKEADVLDSMLRKWIQENEKNLRLDNFLTGATTINIIQPQTVNIAVKAELTFCKMELERLVSLCEKRRGEQNYGDFLRDLTKIVLRASKIQQAAHDPELGDLLAKAEAHLR